MSLELWLSNLWFYSLQTGILILVGGLLAWIFSLRDPGGLYVYWRLLLAGCLILVFQLGVPAPLPSSVPLLPLSLIEHPVIPPSSLPTVEPRSVVNVYPWLAGLLVTGLLLRLIWLGVGFYRLHRIEGRTRRLSLPPHLQLLEAELGVSARYCVSPEVAGPVSFGWLRPVIILPESFSQWGKEMQRAVVCHELLHVKRRDWVWNTADELVKSLFWFHPPFHWLMRRIQLTREQVVDRQAIAVLGSRKTYLQSLVEIARQDNSASSLPAPLFLKECQLSRRVRLLLQLREVTMSKKRTIVSLTVSCVLLVATGWWSLSALPLTVPPSARFPQAEPAAQEPIRVGSNVMKGKLVHRVDPEYPAHLAAVRRVGLVILSAVIRKNGEVRQVDVLRGAKDGPAVDSAVVEAVRQWRYEPYELNGIPISVTTTVFVHVPQTETAADEPVHVGDNVMEMRLIHRVDPEYPPQLAAARPIGLVILSVVIRKKGEVQQMEIARGETGEPALNSAAMKTVMQWRYEPFALDGVLVPVRTSVVVRFPPEQIGSHRADDVIGEMVRQSERLQKEIEHVVSEVTGFDLTRLSQEIQREVERVRKEIERVGSEMSEMDLRMLGQSDFVIRILGTDRNEVHCR